MAIDEKAKTLLDEKANEFKAKVLQKAIQIATWETVPVFPIHIERAHMELENTKQSQVIPSFLKTMGAAIFGFFFNEVLQSLNAGSSSINLTTMLLGLIGIFLISIGNSNWIQKISYSLFNRQKVNIPADLLRSPDNDVQLPSSVSVTSVAPLILDSGPVKVQIDDNRQ